MRWPSWRGDDADHSAAGRGAFQWRLLDDAASPAGLGLIRTGRNSRGPCRPAGSAARYTLTSGAATLTRGRLTVRSGGNGRRAAWSIAVSSEACPGLDPWMDTGSREENASKQESGPSVLILSEPKRL